MQSQQQAFFKELFSWGWHQKKLNADDGLVYLTSAMRDNDTELLRFLIDQGVRLKLDDKPLQDSGRGWIDFQTFTERGLGFAASPPLELVEILFRGVEPGASTVYLAAWMADWAIEHHDLNLLTAMQAKGIELTLDANKLGQKPYASYMPALIGKALETANIQALRLMGYQPDLTLDLRAYLPGSESGSRWEAGQLTLAALNAEALEFYCRLYGDCQGRPSLAEWPRRRQELLLAVSGDNPEQMASESGIRYLLAKGAEPDPPTGRTAAMALVKAKNATLSLLQALHQAGADLRRVDSEARNVLYHAVAGGNLDIVKWLLDSGIQPETGAPAGQEVQSSQAVLRAAVIQGNVQIIDLLLSKLAPATIPKDLALTALESRHPELAEKLSQYGLDPKIAEFKRIGQAFEEASFTTLFRLYQDTRSLNRLIFTAISEALEPTQPPSIGPSASPPKETGLQLLDANGKGLTVSEKRAQFLMQVLNMAYQREDTKPLAWAFLPDAMPFVSVADRARLEQWFNEGLKAGLTPDSTSLGCYSLLQGAVRRGEPERVKQLIRAGADLEFRGSACLRDGYTPLQMAIQARNESILRILLESGSSLKVYGPDLLPSGQIATPLALALRNPQDPRADAVVWTLLPLTDLSAPENKTLLFYAVENGRLGVVKRLAQYHDLKLKDHFDRNLLFYATGPQADTLISYLLTQGLEINALSRVGETPLAQASTDLLGAERFASLLKHGADPCAGRIYTLRDQRYSETLASRHLAELRKSCGLAGQMGS